MMEWPPALSHWLASHGIDPERVSVVLQTDDLRTKDAIECAFKRELGHQFLTVKTPTTGVLKYCGLNIEVRALPHLLKRLVGLS
jgi:hypothetical protein